MPPHTPRHLPPKLEPVAVPLAEADGLMLVSALTALTDVPAFPVSAVDGYAIRGPGPWPVVGRILAGSVPESLLWERRGGDCHGPMVPDEQIIRVEGVRLQLDGRVSGQGHRPGNSAIPATKQPPETTCCLRTCRSRRLWSASRRSADTTRCS